MKARITSRHISCIENGVRKGYGDIVEVTKEQIKNGGYAPLKINVKRKPKDADTRTEAVNADTSDAKEEDKS